MTGVTQEAELILSVTVSPDLEPRSRADQDGPKDDPDGRNLVCRIVVELSSYTPLRDVQVCVDVPKPFVADKDCYTLPNLCKHIARKLVTHEPKISTEKAPRVNRVKNQGRTVTLSAPPSR